MPNDSFSNLSRSIIYDKANCWQIGVLVSQSTDIKSAILSRLIRSWSREYSMEVISRITAKGHVERCAHKAVLCCPHRTVLHCPDRTVSWVSSTKDRVLSSTQYLCRMVDTILCHMVHTWLCFMGFVHKKSCNVVHTGLTFGRSMSFYINNFVLLHPLNRQMHCQRKINYLSLTLIEE